MRGRHEIHDQLLPPADHALHHIQREHPQRVKDIGAFVNQDPFILIFHFPEDLLELHQLAQTGLSRYDGLDCVLDGRFFRLKVFDLLHDQVGVLLGREAIDAIEEHGSVVVWNQVSLPSLKQFFFQVINDGVRYLGLL